MKKIFLHNNITFCVQFISSFPSISFASIDVSVYLSLALFFILFYFFLFLFFFLLLSARCAVQLYVVLFASGRTWWNHWITSHDWFVNSFMFWFFYTQLSTLDFHQSFWNFKNEPPKPFLTEWRSIEEKINFVKYPTRSYVKDRRDRYFSMGKRIKRMY